MSRKHFGSEEEPALPDGIEARISRRQLLRGVGAGTTVAAIGVGSVGTAAAATTTVTGGGGALQTAIDNASSGDTIIVGDSKTYDPITIDVTDLTVNVASGETPTIDGQGGNVAVSIAADGVTFDGFTVTNQNGLLGIKIQPDYDGVTVSNNTVDGVGPTGNLGVTGIIIGTGSHDSIEIVNNTVQKLDQEIDEDGGFPTLNGILADEGGSSDSLTNSTIANNTVRNLESDIAPLGIIIQHDATDVTINGNEITGLLAAHETDSDDTDDASGEFTTFAQGINITSSSTSNVSIVRNDVSDVISEDGFFGEAIKIDGDASGVTVRRNNLLAPLGVTNADSDELSAKCNWWGSDDGPSVAPSVLKGVLSGSDPVVLTKDSNQGQGGGFANPWDFSSTKAHVGDGSWGTIDRSGQSISSYKQGFYFAGEFDNVDVLPEYTVSDIEEISYWLYEPDALEGVDIYLNIYTKPEGDGDDSGSFYDSRLQALPAKANQGSPDFTAEEWNKFSTKAGAANTLAWSDTGRGGNFTLSLPTLEDLQAGTIDWSTYGANLSISHDYRDEVVRALSLQVGSVSGVDLEAWIDDITVKLTSGETLRLDLEQDGGAGDGRSDVAGPVDFEPWLVGPIEDNAPCTGGAPAVSNVSASPNPVAVDTETDLTALVDNSLPSDTDVASAEYSLDGGSTWMSMSASDGSFSSPTEEVEATLDPFSTPEVKTVCVRGIDTEEDTGPATCLDIAIYDPDGGFVTGGGWIDSPEGAYKGDESATGKATFGFVSKYKKGANEPTGNTQFRFRAAGLNFKSDDYEWLVVSGDTAQFKGTGSLKGHSGDYMFKVKATDGDLDGGASEDAFRIKIVDKATDEVIYDNGAKTPLGGGNIIVHEG